MKHDFRLAHIQFSHDNYDRLSGIVIKFKDGEDRPVLQTCDVSNDSQNSIESAIRKRDELIAKHYGMERLFELRKGRFIGMNYPHPGFDYLGLAEKTTKSKVTGKETKSLYVKVKKAAGGYKQFSLMGQDVKTSDVLDKAIEFWFREYKVALKAIGIKNIKEASDAINPFFRLYVRQRLSSILKDNTAANEAI